MAAVIQRIVDQHAEDAAFLWLLRDRAVAGPGYRLRELARLDERVEAGLDGLRVAGEAGWRTAIEALRQYREPGEAFAAAVLAFESGAEARIGAVLAVAEGEAGLGRAVVSALGWIPAPQLRGTVSALLDSAEPGRRALGVAACSVHRVDPGRRLVALMDDAPEVRARALRLAGEVGRSDLAGRVAAGIEDVEGESRFWAAWAAALLGERRRGLASLEAEVLAGGPRAGRALDLALRVMGRAEATAWLGRLGGETGKVRLVVAGAGIVGNPGVVPWLIRRMEDPAVARLAGESFSMITGVYLDEEGLAGAAAEPDEPGEDAASRHDEDLPVPDVAAVRKWWERHGGGLRDGERYLGGKVIGESGLREVLARGRQRQRLAAALELAVMRAGAGVFECRARGRMQERAVSKVYGE
jgi:uncharacterized protein (TIGR02270 family)